LVGLGQCQLSIWLLDWGRGRRQMAEQIPRG